MVKGTSFFQQSYTWTMSDTWLFRKLLNSRLKAFTTSGIIGFWENFCLKYCKKPPELQNLPIISKARTFKAQRLGSNLFSVSYTVDYFCHFYPLFPRGTFFHPNRQMSYPILKYRTDDIALRQCLTYLSVFSIVLPLPSYYYND
jgi:hypothetical protein